MIDSALDLGVDGVQFPYFDPRLLSTIWLSKVRLPGSELPLTWLLADTQFRLDKDTSMLFAYTADKHREYYDLRAVGFEYLGI